MTAESKPFTLEIREGHAVIVWPGGGWWTASCVERTLWDEKEAAKGRATAAEERCRMLENLIKVLRDEVDDLSYCMWCGEDLWTEEDVMKGFALRPGKHAADCKYIAALKELGIQEGGEG